MAAANHLAGYAKGWTHGNVDKILGSVTDDYIFDDPNAGEIPKSGIAPYLTGLKETVSSIRGEAADGETLMELTEIVTSETDGVLTAWCWWTIPGTPMQGSGLIKAGDHGVKSERITYYTRLPG